jgi:mycothiol synthase
VPQPVVPEGYLLRNFRLQDAPAYYALMEGAGFKNWSDEMLIPWLGKQLPHGFWVVEHVATGALVATAMATRNPKPLHPDGGELGWVAGDARHAGHGLGVAVCAAVMRSFHEANVARVYLLTDDWRLPAIKVYLKLGWAPFLFAPDMEERWKVVCEQLKWPFAPEAWPRA